MKKVLLSVAIMVTSFTGFSQVGIGTTNPDASAELDVTSTTKGFLPPRMTKAQMDAISPSEGLIIYCTNCIPKGLYTANGATYISMRTGGVNLPTAVTLAAGEVYTATGRIWMDKNLGAAQVATSSTDIASYGSFYQWGRATDGHELLTSSVVAGPVVDGTEGSSFITNNTTPFDWLTVAGDTRWNGASKGTEDPCPLGYRVPTSPEWIAEVLTWSSNDGAGAFASPLKIPLAGLRQFGNGVVDKVGTSASIWSSTASGIYAKYLRINDGSGVWDDYRAYGLSVRCIKE